VSIFAIAPSRIAARATFEAKLSVRTEQRQARFVRFALQRLVR